MKFSYVGSHEVLLRLNAYYKCLDFMTGFLGAKAPLHLAKFIDSLIHSFIHSPKSLKIAISYLINSDIVRYCQILSDIVKYNSKGVSRVFHGCFKGVSRVF